MVSGKCGLVAAPSHEIRHWTAIRHKGMILVFGKTGQVAQELQKFNGVLALDRTRADLTDLSACAKAIFNYKPRAVINAAAYTAVDMAEDEEDLSKRLATVLDEIREVMEKRKTRIESLRQEIADIERDNEELEKTIADLLATFN